MTLYGCPNRFTHPDHELVTRDGVTTCSVCGSVCTTNEAELRAQSRWHFMKTHPRPPWIPKPTGNAEVIPLRRSPDDDD